jgi:hypothetical protein
MKEAAERAVKDGFVNTISTFESRFRISVAINGDPDWALYSPEVYNVPEPTGRELIDHGAFHNVNHNGEAVTVCVIGDAHDDPRMPDKSRFEVLGKWAASMCPDYIVQLGDWATFDSFNRYTERGSYESQLLPTSVTNIFPVALVSLE